MKFNNSPPFLNSVFTNFNNKTKKMKAVVFFIFSIVILTPSCKKNNCTSFCLGKTKPTGQFIIKEILGDTAFISDTIFRDNAVKFQAVDIYESINWKLGSDPRDWNAQEFSLSFINAIGNIPITLTGKRSPDNTCFPNDSGVYSTTKPFTLVEQIEKPTLTISPLVGIYKGYFTNNPFDTFTTRLSYFDSTKYDVGVTGSKNFYWLSNMPNGYTSSLGWSYQELNNGQPVEMGYKCFRFGSSTDIIQGKGWLSNDTLYISYGNDFVGRKKFIGKKN